MILVLQPKLGTIWMDEEQNNVQTPLQQNNDRGNMFCNLIGTGTCLDEYKWSNQMLQVMISFTHQSKSRVIY